MKIIIKRLLIFGLLIFLLMQVYQPDRNVNYGQNMPMTFTKVYNVPKNVATVLRTSCYDCHSNTTIYPWYSYVQPARLFMEDHIQEGKEELNFDEFGTYSKRKQNNKLKSIIGQIKSDEMPLSSYTFIHRDALLSPSKKQVVINWIEKLKDPTASQK